MCGVYAVASKKNIDIFSEIHQGLRNLEYRGYDSWGISWLDQDKIKTFKTTKPLKTNVNINTNSKIAIGHTRWATHGNVTETNAHPHYATDNSFVLVQNGIVENYLELKTFLLKKGYKFKTQTDTEVIVRLIEYYQKTKSEKAAIISAFKRLKGRNTIVVLFTNKIYAIKNGSPLTVGILNDKYIISSDTLSYANQTNSALILDDYQMVVIENSNLEAFDISANKKMNIHPEKLNYENINNSKDGFPHFMKKEIFEQSQTILSATNIKLFDLKPIIELIRKSKKVYTIGAGTASFAAGQAAYYLRTIAGVNATELKAYEVDSYENIFDKHCLIFAFSQSGETADTIEALTLAKNKQAKVVSVVNMVGATISRMADYNYSLKCGPEICVASTKAFTAKLAWSYLFANSLVGNYKNARLELNNLSKKLKNYVTQDLNIKINKLAKQLVDEKHIYVLGKGQNYYMAQEGALKIKEISYIHTEAFSAGELKHGMIALVSKGVPVICTVSHDANEYEVLNAIAEVKARGGKIIAFAYKPNELFDYYINVPDCGELTAIANIIPYQLLAYNLALLKNLDPDKPRNLAKSVTVK